MNSFDEMLDRHIRIGSILCESASNQIKAIRLSNKSLKDNESKKMFLAGCLFIDSSAKMIKESLVRLKIAKRLRPKEYDEAIDAVISAAPGVVSGLSTIISKYKRDPKGFDSSVIFNYLEKTVDILDDLYDLSESIIFRKDGRDFFALQDRDLNKWSKEIVDYLESNMKLIKSMQKNKDRSINKIGVNLEKSIKRLSNHIKRSKVKGSLLSGSEVVSRLAFDNNIIQMISA